MCTGCLFIVYLEAFINVLFIALTIAIFGRVILSWVPTRLPWGLGEFIFSMRPTTRSRWRRASSNRMARRSCGSPDPRW